MRRPDEWTLPLGFRHELVVDNFAGGGGASTGIEQAIGRPIDIAINHDPEAIAMHRVNHPHTQHYCESVYKVDPDEITHNEPVGLAWFSPDCKHFSKAKGGAPVSPRVRGLAWVVVRWAKRVKPRVIMLENVEEFQDWGPLTDEGLPDTTKKGRTFLLWVNQLRRYGYQVEWRELRASDYGTPTIRKRLFVIARHDGLPIVWPEATHGKGLLPYRTAGSDVVDFSIDCPSIFTRARPLAENTLRRIARGIKKYVIDSPEPFLVEAAHGEFSKDGRKRWGQGIRGMDEPIGTVHAGGGNYAVVTPYLTEHANGSAQRNFDAAEPLRTQCASVKGGHFAIVAPTLIPRYGERDGQAPRCRSVDKPLPVVVPTQNGAALVAAFMAQHNTGVTGHTADDPISTLTGRCTQQQLVTSHLLKLRNNQFAQATDEPMPTLTSGGGHVGEVRAFLLKYYSEGGQWQSLNDPMHTVPTRDRLGLVLVKGQPYQIVDIGMRMLTPRELYRAQGFPAAYVIDFEYNGKPLTKTAQARMCGNSVCPPLSRILVEANFAHEKVMSRFAA